MYCIDLLSVEVRIIGMMTYQKSRSSLVVVGGGVSTLIIHCNMKVMIFVTLWGEVQLDAF